MDTVSRYFHDIRRSNPLTKDAEIELAKKAQAGDEAALNQLIEANLRFVVTIARQYQGRGLALEDLIAEGNIGLIEAAKRFNPDEGYRFISYGVFWIRESIQSAINSNKLIRLPMNKISSSIAIHKVTSKYMDREGRKPTETELSKECGISIRDVRTILRANQFAVDLDQKLSDDEDSGTLESILTNPQDRWADEDTTKEGLQTDLLVLVKSILSGREYTCIVESFGIGCEALSDEAIAKKLNVSAERVRQIKLQSLHKLRHSMNPELKEILKSYLG